MLIDLNRITPLVICARLLGERGGEARIENPTLSESPPTVSNAANVAANERWGDEIANHGKLQVLDEIMAENCVDHDTARTGVQGAKASSSSSPRCATRSRLRRPPRAGCDGRRVRRNALLDREHPRRRLQRHGADALAVPRQRHPDRAFHERHRRRALSKTDQLGMLDQLGFVKIG